MFFTSTMGRGESFRPLDSLRLVLDSLIAFGKHRNISSLFALIASSYYVASTLIAFTRASRRASYTPLYEKMSGGCGIFFEHPRLDIKAKKLRLPSTTYDVDTSGLSLRLVGPAPGDSDRLNGELMLTASRKWNTYAASAEGHTMRAKPMRNMPTAISRRLSAELALPGQRRILIVGRPGSGKSTAIETAFCEFEGEKLNAEFAGKLSDSGYHLSEVVPFDLLVIDDIDRLEMKTQQFDYISRCARHILATANDLSDMDVALLRPGRFDVIIRMDISDDEAMRNLVGDDLELLALPIAYASEYAERVRRGVPPERAKAELIEHHAVVAEATTKSELKRRSRVAEVLRE